MGETKSFASLSPTLLARKGGAKPAMRPQLQPLHEFHHETGLHVEDDLGWNDHGEPHDHHGPTPADQLTPAANKGGEPADQQARLVPIEGGKAERPAILDQQDRLARQIEKQGMRRRSALAEGRRAAFTLRIDAERHLRLRLASTVLNRSAQQLVTEALDEFLAAMPEVESLARKVGKHR